LFKSKEKKSYLIRPQGF